MNETVTSAVSERTKQSEKVLPLKEKKTKETTAKNYKTSTPVPADTLPAGTGKAKVKKVAAKTTKAVKKSVTKKGTPKTVQLNIQLRFHTQYGQDLFITGDHPLLGSNDHSKALPMQYFNDEYWTAQLELPMENFPKEGIIYNYLLKNSDGSTVVDWGSDKVLDPKLLTKERMFIHDSWNHAGFFENAFYTEPFSNVLLKNNYTAVKKPAAKKFTHLFKVKSPLLQKGQTLCITGLANEMGAWDKNKVVLLQRDENEDAFSVKLDLSAAQFPLVYKYGVYDVKAKTFLRYEDGNNRFLYDAVQEEKVSVINDGLAVLPMGGWKGAGVAIPVFSLRSDESWGCGEFTDLQRLTDWSEKVGLKLIQILPVNDSTATHTWHDSYPYAAISAFALHPMYLNPLQATTKEHRHLLGTFYEEKSRLNVLTAVDYEAVNAMKWNIIRAIYPLQKEQTFAEAAYKEFYDANEHWLVPYAMFCYLRDAYSTPDFTLWPSDNTYSKDAADALLNKSFDELGIHFFIQYHLHLQLKDATRYAHKKGIIVKGDIAIGVYRFGADAWQHPELYHMEMQAGAPPDDFAVKGQNWGFPTYNWQVMQQNGFAWWKQRFEQMSNYFDAFRIDHILGFFRIWSIPLHAVEGIMGYFVPDLPVHINEFNEKHIWFDYGRYCNPFITDQVLWDMAGDQSAEIKKHFLLQADNGQYRLKTEFATQRQVEKYFAGLEINNHNTWLKQCLFDLISNVVLFPVEDASGQQFRFRFGMQETTSFKNLEGGTQHQLEQLYVNYFFRRQDNFWRAEAMKKLPALKRVTNMLVCGEDLGMVPDCVPDAMKQLGILSLEIQRMPKQTDREFFHPNDAPYMSVVTPSTHDMSTIRGWWEEDRSKTQRFYNQEMGSWGDAPFFCDAWVNEAVILQHLYSPAMWSIFQLQDLLGMSKELRRENPHDERINIPANPKHYWQYRMHLSLEDLIKEEVYNNSLFAYIKACGRI